MSKAKNKTCRMVLGAYAIAMAGAFTAAVGGLGLLAIHAEEARDAKVKAAPVVIHVSNDHWQDHVYALQEKCGLALDTVAAGMAEEEFDSIPLEVWQSAYQQCLFDAGATI